MICAQIPSLTLSAALLPILFAHAFPFTPPLSVSLYQQQKLKLSLARSITGRQNIESLCAKVGSDSFDFEEILKVERTYEYDRGDDDDAADESTGNHSGNGDTITTEHEIRYHIHRRMNLSSQQAAPILVLHGGPGLPSDYLLPLRDVVPYRSIVFYDQLGCGRSTLGSPRVAESYSIESSLDDLEALIRKVGLRRFHLYGQSFGGILAFEYLKRVAEGRSTAGDTSKCLSVVLSNAPCNVDQVEGVANELVTKLLEEDKDETTVTERFRVNRQCRTEETPRPLVDAYARAASPGMWRGTESIRGWKAVAPLPTSQRMPSAMVVRGEYDFVTEECVSGWKEIFNHPFVRLKVMDDCSHHCLLEKGDMYGELVDSFFAEYD